MPPRRFMVATAMDEQVEMQLPVHKTILAFLPACSRGRRGTSTLIDIANGITPDMAQSAWTPLALTGAAYAIFLPKGTAGPIVQKLHDAVTATMDRPEMRERLREIGADLVGPGRRSPDYLDVVAMTVEQDSALSWACVSGRHAARSVLAANPRD